MRHAHEWLTEQFEPIVQSVPIELRAKLEPAELYHEMLEHRWFMSERAGAEIGMEEAAQTYVTTVLRELPDEEVAVSALESDRPLANLFDSSDGFLDDEDDKPYGPMGGRGNRVRSRRAGCYCLPRYCCLAQKPRLKLANYSMALRG
jgi:hypothetical protein